MNDAQLKLSSQICFPLYSASRLITKAYKPYLDEMGITYPQYVTTGIVGKRWTLRKSNYREAALEHYTFAITQTHGKNATPTAHSFY
jgi:hypothetical protein